MADKDESGGGDGSVLGITIEIVFVLAILAVVVFGLNAPFSPNFLNLNYIFGKMLIFFRGTLDFFINGNVGISIKLFADTLIVFLVGLSFYLLIRILEMEDEHEEHVYHHAEDGERPRHLMSQVLFDAKEFARDTKGLVTTVASTASDSSADLFDKMLYRDDADIFDKTPVTPDATFKEEVDEKEGSSKWRMVLKHIGSKNPSDWKIAIIEADTILDALVERAGFAGDTLGERMKNADRGVFKTLDFAWEAHKTRNRIAHEGSSFNLSERDAKLTIQQYEEVFKEFGYI